jgi:hypothetical protein
VDIGNPKDKNVPTYSRMEASMDSKSSLVKYPSHKSTIHVNGNIFD